MALREIFARFGIEMDARPLVEGEQSVSALTDKLRSLGAVVAGGALVVAIRSFAEEFVNIADEIGDTSAALGLSTDELQSWRHAAELSGVRAGAMDAAFLKLQNGIAEGNPALRELGIQTRGAAGHFRTAAEVLGDLADPIAALPTDADRTRVLMDLLGRSGARLGPLFARGSEGLAEVRAELQALGGGVTPEAAAAAGDLDDAMIRLNAVTLSLKSRLAVLLLPVIEWMAEASAAAGAALAKLADRGRLVETALVLLGVAFTVVAGQAIWASAATIQAWLAAAAPFVALGILILGLVLLIEDMWVGLETGSSALGDLGTAMDEWSSNAMGWLEPVAGAWLLFRDTIREIVNIMGEMAGMGSDILGLDAPDAAQIGGQVGGARARARDLALSRQRDAAAAARAPAPVPVSAPSPAAADANRALFGIGAPVPTGGGAPGAAPQITNSFRVQVNADGLSAAQAEAMTSRAISRALGAQADDLTDTLGQ